MRLSQSLLATLREAPNDAETRGIQMLTRAGYVRKIGAGLYAQLPLMTRVMQRLEALIREELDPISQEVSLPVMQPQALWQESGRWDAYTQAEGIMFTVQDRAGRQHALGPTHEEVAVEVVRGLVQSYRDLSVSIYQIGRKFRDELRPRFGLLRTREFTMKDAYSFHADEASLREHFEAMSAAYGRILTRLGADWRMVEADSGAIGGSASREFVILSEVGEDEILFSPDGHYAANAERAVSLPHAAAPSPFAAYAKHHTPNTPTVAAACAVLGCDPAHMVKNVLYDAKLADGTVRPVLVSLRGDHAVNAVKLWNVLSARLGSVLVGLDVADTTNWGVAVPLGYIAPDFAAPDLLRLVDEAAAEARDFTTGANEPDFHVVGANWGEHFALPEVVDVRQAVAGERCLHDPTQVLHSARGIEVGHVFQLGTKYSEAMGATFTAADGSEQPFVMGCYGIGVTRLAQAIAEQTADDAGLNWPQNLAPYDVILTVVDTKNAEQIAAAEGLYTELRGAGLSVLLDDRPLRAGAKFADADLLGIPYRVTLGRGLERGEVEVKVRGSGETRALTLSEVVGALS